MGGVGAARDRVLHDHLDGTSLLTALPSITTDLDLGPTAAAWTVTSYALAFSGPLLLCGRAADLFGRRRLFLSGVFLRMLAALVCGLAPTAQVLIAGRVLQGLSAAIIAPAALAMVMATFPEGRDLNKALGIWGGLGGLGATAGLLVGGLLTSTAGWPWVFWINLPVVLIVLVASPRLLEESRAPDRSRLGVPNGLLATATLSLTVYTITDIGARARFDLFSGALVLTVAAAAALLVHAQRRTSAPLLPPVLTDSRRLRVGAALLLIAGIVVDGMLVTLTAYTQDVLRWSPGRFGVSTTLMTATAVLSGLAAQRVVTAVGVRPIPARGCHSPGRADAPILLALLIFGAGMGATAVGAHITALTGAPPGHSGVVAAVADGSFAIGTALGVAVAATAAAVTATQATAGTSSGARGAFLIVDAIAVTGIFTATRLRPAP